MQKSCLLLLAIVPFVYGGTLMEEVAKLDGTNIIRDLLNSTGLGVATDNDYLTLFIPTDDAFAKVPDEVGARIMGNSSILLAVLQFHATKGIFRSVDAQNNMLIASGLAGSNIRVNVYQDKTGAPFPTLNGAKVVKADIQASNGYLHLIDSVMFPPMGNFYDLISGSANHTTLKTVIDDNGMQQVFQTATGTCFAPTNDAFTALSNLLTSKNITLNNKQANKEFILYHLLQDVVYSAGGRAGKYNTMNQGQTVTASVVNGTGMINQARVVMPDFPATNGVLHIIDSVLVPEPYATQIMMA